MKLDPERYPRASELQGDSPVDTALLLEMHEGALGYLLAHDWCEEILESRFGLGVGGVVAVFLCLTRVEDSGLEWIWVIEGDLPSAYLVSDDAPTPAQALRAYVGLMEDWVQAVLTAGDLESVFPVAAPTDDEHAKMLGLRLASMRQDIR